MHLSNPFVDACPQPPFFSNKLVHIFFNKIAVEYAGWDSTKLLIVIAMQVTKTTATTHCTQSSIRT